MTKYNLSFISDEQILLHVLDTVKKYRFDIDLKAFNKNLIDPIKLTFDSKIYNKSISDLIENEVLRQIDKSNTNHIGYFHQNIFNHFGEGWKIPASGYDVINEGKKIFVEMKNKHNTMNSSSSQKTYMRMQHTLLETPDATCLLVEVIARNSQDIIWKNSLDGQPVSNEKIRRVSINKFYEIVTGDALAFKKLCEALPQIISDAIDKTKNNSMKNTVFDELKSISPNLMKSIYLLSFSKYEGFNKLEVSEI
ncbi:MAG: Eco47II family restriction endonuclease [Alphaproteobacteria bacterium]|nr:Eco47II family restriction endonuclease [Alphaproteobacteria bacterium]